MSQEFFILVQGVLFILNLVGYAGCFVWFHFPYFSQGREWYLSKVVKMVVIFIIYSVLFSMGTIFLKVGISFRIEDWMKEICILAMMVFLSKYILTISYRAEILLCSLYLVCQSLSSLLLQGLQYFFLSRYVVNEVNSDIMLFRAALVSGFAMVLQQAICFGMLWRIKKYLYREEMEFRISELFNLVIFPLIGILTFNVIERVTSVNRLVNNERQIFILYETYPVFLWVVPILSVLIYLGVLVALHSYLVTKRMYEERENNRLEQQMTHDLMERTREVEQFYQGIRSVKHEMRNHLTNIQGLVQNKKYAEIEGYLSELNKSMDEFELSIKTGNPVTDVIINDKKRMAEDEGILFESQFVCPQSDSYNIYDIGIIVNNLLINAIEACERDDNFVWADGGQEKKERYIVLTGRTKGKFYLIEVRNSFDGKIEIDSKSGLPLSVKKDHVDFHGIGLSNVRREAKKYLGDIKIHCEDHEFCAVVLLQGISRQE